MKMAFVIKKKKYRFEVRIEIEELSSVPFVSGVLFCKFRLLDGGSFTEYSPREEVKNHSVKWNAKYCFQTKLAANSISGILETCLCRVSVRKELKGGKSYQKLGYADLNLSEYAGCGSTTRRFLLEGYDAKRRQDNSILKINIDMSLLSGDPLFKVPASKSSLSANEAVELHADNKGGSEGDLAADDSNSSGFGSLPRKSTAADSDVVTSSDGMSGGTQITINAHTGIQTQSSVPSSTSLVHDSHSLPALPRTPSAGSLSVPSNSRIRPLTRPKFEACSSIEKRVDSTRISAEDLVNQLIADTNFDDDEDTAEMSGLQLYVGRDGSTLLGGQKDKGHFAAGHFQRVVIDKK